MEIKMKKIMLLTICLTILASFSCSKKEDRSPYAEFKVNGAHKHYRNSNNFSTNNLCGSSTWCGHFKEHPTILSKNVFKIGIPGDPIVGHTYIGDEVGYIIRYNDHNEKEYLKFDSTMTVTFTKWDGSGGWAHGNFSGSLKSDDGDIVQIQNGYFENKIE